MPFHLGVAPLGDGFFRRSPQANLLTWVAGGFRRFHEGFDQAQRNHAADRSPP